MSSFMSLVGGVVACAAAVAAVAAKEPRSVDYSGKSTAELAGCVVLSLSESRGYEVQKSVNGASTEIILKFRAVGISGTAANFVIDDLGDRRRVTIFARGKDSGAPQVIAAKARKCVNPE